MTRRHPQHVETPEHDHDENRAPTRRDEDSATRADTGAKSRGGTAPGDERRRDPIESEDLENGTRDGIVGIDGEPEKRHNRAGG